MNTIKTITIIGAGCVGTFLAKELFKRGYKINEIVSRREETAKTLALEVGAKAVSEEYEMVGRESDIYIVCVKDEVIMEVRKKLHVRDKIVVHTSGSMPIDVFKKSTSNYGVLYPLQTIIRERNYKLEEIPFFITANNKATLALINQFASSFSKQVIEISDEKRAKLHLAAVFASNFVNYLLKISKEILDNENLDFELLKPLVDESIAKAFDVGPVKSQTGPAKRGECNTIDKHISLLKKDEYKKIYSLLSDMIHADFKNGKGRSYNP
jgi:predicted short-subunit dehydrogenase-like oxidoreductase (DUF2520 family)